MVDGAYRYVAHDVGQGLDKYIELDLQARERWGPLRGLVNG